MNIQLFKFNTQDIRTLKDDKGVLWFVAKDVCNILGYKKSATAVVNQHCRKKGCTEMVLPSAGGKQRTLLINEGNLYRLVTKSEMPDADTFEEWVFDEVLPTLRKTGRYVITDYLQESPRTWSKVYPDKYFEHVLRLYGYQFQKGVNPPQFIGHFTNEYVYKALDGQLPDELKKRQDQTLSIEEQRSLMHQFLNSEGKDVLEKHLDKVVTLMEVSSTIDHFKSLWSRSVTHRSQMELYLR